MKYVLSCLFILVGLNAHAGKLSCFADNGSSTEIGFDEDREIDYVMMQTGLTDIELVRNAKIDILEATPIGHALKIDFLILEDATGEIILIVDGDAYLDRSGIYKVTSCEFVE